MNDRIAKLEVKRERLHQYVIDKLEERDYHAVQDAGSDLREIDMAIKILEDFHRAANLAINLSEEAIRNMS